MEDKAERGSAETLEFNGDLQHLGDSSGERPLEMEPALSELLQSIHEGAQKLAEATARDAQLGGELCASLTAYTGRLGATLELPPESFPNFYDAEKMYLTHQGQLVVVDKRGKVNSRALDEYPTDVVLVVVWNALPLLQSAIQMRAQRLGERVDLFDRISSELRRLPIPAEEASGEGSDDQGSEQPEA